MFNAGDEIYLNSDKTIHWLQILSVGSDYLVKDYWETQSLEEYRELRIWVKRVSLESVTAYTFHQNLDLTDKDAEEISRFLEIEKGLNFRKERTQKMPALVQASMLSENYNEALGYLLEWAMLEKYRLEIYSLQAECYQKLGKTTEANYALEVQKLLSDK